VVSAKTLDFDQKTEKKLFLQRQFKQNGDWRQYFIVLVNPQTSCTSEQLFTSMKQLKRYYLN